MSLALIAQSYLPEGGDLGWETEDCVDMSGKQAVANMFEKESKPDICSNENSFPNKERAARIIEVVPVKNVSRGDQKSKDIFEDESPTQTFQQPPAKISIMTNPNGSNDNNTHPVRNKNRKVNVNRNKIARRISVKNFSMPRWASKRWCCQECTCTFSTVGYLRIHENRVHGKTIITSSVYHKCQICNIGWDRLSRLESHMKLHAGGADRPWKCSRCSCSFKQAKRLDFHTRQVHLGNRKAVTNSPCTICGKNFVDIYSLAVHMHNHSGQKPIKCPSCKHVYSDKSNTIRHLRTLHGQKGTVACLKLMKDSISNREQSPSLPSRDRLYHHQLRACKVVLTRCDTYLLYKQAHVQLGYSAGEHKGIKRKKNIGRVASLEEVEGEPDEEVYHPQNGNGSRSESKSKMPSGSNQSGMKPTAQSRRIYKCPYCMESFQDGISLIKHLPIHNSEAATRTSTFDPTCEHRSLPSISEKISQLGNNGKVRKWFSCHLCTYSCKMYQSLQIHVARHKKNGNKFKCSLCACFFGNYKALRIHMGHLHKDGIKGVKQK